MYSLNTLWFKFFISLAIRKIIDDWIYIKISWILGITVYERVRYPKVLLAVLWYP